MSSNNIYADPRDGNVYRTITIDNQVWMVHNLKYLPSIVGPDIGSNTIPYCYVNDYDGTNVKEAKLTAIYKNYGVLYNWEAANTFCPPGWHLPSVAEWKQLIDNYRNHMGFVPFPGGSRFPNEFELIGFTCNWWTANNSYTDFHHDSLDFLLSDDLSTSTAWYQSLGERRFIKLSAPKEWGLSVRCVRD